MAASVWCTIAEAALLCLGMLLLIAWTISDAERTRLLCALIRALRTATGQRAPGPAMTPGQSAVSTARRPLGRSRQ